MESLVLWRIGTISTSTSPRSKPCVHIGTISGVATGNEIDYRNPLCARSVRVDSRSDKDLQAFQYLIDNSCQYNVRF